MALRSALWGAARSVFAGLLLAFVFAQLYVRTSGIIASVFLLTVAVGLLIATLGPIWFLGGRAVWERVRPNA